MRKQRHPACRGIPAGTALAGQMTDSSARVLVIETKSEGASAHAGIPSPGLSLQMA
jgi:hypothetical protein